MAPVSQLGLVLLTTASVAYAERHGHARGHRHVNRRQNSAYLTAPFGYGNGTATAGPTGSGTASLPDTTSTSTETITSTLTSTITVPGQAYPSEGSGSGDTPVDGDSAPTCGGTVYVTVTDQVTVTASAGSPGTTADSGSGSGYGSDAGAGSGSGSGSGSSSDAGTGSDAGSDAGSDSGEDSGSDSLPDSGEEATTSPAAAATPPGAAYVASPTAPTNPVNASPETTESEEAPAPTVTETPSAPTSYDAPSTTATVQPTTRDLPGYGSSSAPAPSATGSSGGSTGGPLKTKRGCLYEPGKNECQALMSGNSNAFSWIANWGSSSDGDNHGLTFIPQLWGKMSQDGTTDFTKSWNDNCNKAIEAGAPAVLGFNEPERGDQANLQATDAAPLWNQYIAPLQSSNPSLVLVSPSVSSDGESGGTGYKGLNWLVDFAGKGASWDATGLHMYADCSKPIDPQVDYLKGYVEKAVSTFSKPIWFTEFGCLPEKGGSQEAQSQFISSATDYLEKHPNVDQYAAFKADTLLSAGTASTYASAPLK